MKIKLILVLLLIFCLSTVKSMEKYEEVRFAKSLENFKYNSIKSIVVSKFEYEFGVPQRTGFVTKDLLFDGNMRVLQSKLYDDDDYEGKIIYEYNSDGDTLKITKFNDDDLEILREDFSYDESSNLSSKEYFKKGLLIAKEEFTYDIKFNLIEFKRFIDGEIDYSLKYTYNDNDQMLTWERYNEENVLDLKSEMTYNEKGLILDSTFYFEGTVDIKAVYKWDERGLLTEYRLNKGNGDLITRSEFKYTVTGVLYDERIYDDFDVLVEMYIIDYEKDGQIKQISKYVEKEFLENIWRFQYHVNGLIKSEQFLNKLEVPQFVRKYKYDPEQN